MRKRKNITGSLRTSPQTGVAISYYDIPVPPNGGFPRQCEHWLGMTGRSKVSKRKWMAVLLLYVVLGNWKGYLALFDGGTTEPRQIYPRLVEELTEEDQAKLNEGILIRNDRRLHELLDGYLS